MPPAGRIRSDITDDLDGQLVIKIAAEFRGSLIVFSATRVASQVAKLTDAVGRVQMGGFDDRFSRNRRLARVEHSEIVIEDASLLIFAVRRSRSAIDHLRPHRDGKVGTDDLFKAAKDVRP